MESLLWEVFEYLKIRNKNWLKLQLFAPQFEFDFPNFSIFYNFQNHVVSIRLEFFWPAKSPDLYPLIFIFWGIAEKSVYDSKHWSLQQLEKIVKLCARNVSRKTLIKAWWKTWEKEPPYAWRMRGATSNTFSNNRLNSFVNKTSHNI